LVSRRIYELLGFACGFVLIDYGFSFVAAGFPGARQLTSQFLGANLIAGGSVAVFASLYYLLRPVSVAPPMAVPSALTRPDVGVETIVEEETPVTVPTAPSPTLPESLEMQVGDFTRSSSGEYERHLSDEIYDMFRMEREGVTAWREDRKGMRSVYLAGPYELSRKLLEDNVKNGEDVRIGILHLSVDSMRELLALLASSAESVPSASS
jgi:hypothetical protein